MPATVEWRRRAAHDLRHLDKQLAEQVRKRVEEYAAGIEAERLEKLSGPLADFYRLRVGDYRVLFKLASDRSLMVVFYVGHRREVYRR